jgi:hypothetical protein
LFAKAFSLGGKEGVCHALTQIVIAGHTGSAFGRPECMLDPAIHVADKSAWTTGTSPVVTKNDKVAL